MHGKALVVALAALALTACAEGPYELEFGTYEVTSGRSQDSTEAWDVDGLTFTIARTPDGIVMDSPTSVVPDLSEVPLVGDHYYREEVSAVVRRCEAGPNSACEYDLSSTMVRVTAPGVVRIESCHRADKGGCSSPNPTCGDPVTHLGDGVSCDRPRLVVGRLVD